MKNEKKIIEEVEKTLQSIDGLKNLEDNPFLFTRIKAEIDKRRIKRKNLPAFNFALKPLALVLILLINIITAIYFIETHKNIKNDYTLVNALKDDYQISQTQSDF